MFEEELSKRIQNFGVPPHMINRSLIGFSAHWDQIMQLLDHRSLPEDGWDKRAIEQLLLLFNHLDSDKDPQAIRIGEREGRISTDILTELSGGFCHGVGRSGNLAAAQPKAAGASLMQNLTNKLVLSLIKDIGLPNVQSALTSPMGTGMSLALALRGCINHFQIDYQNQPIVLMTQVDHKSPIKGLEFIGARIKTIPGKYGENDYSPEGVYTDFKDLEAEYNHNPSQICAIISNTAFFAPRVPDDIKAIAKFAKAHNLIHIINNAYGLQSETLSKLIRSAIDAGRVDAIVQSTDKCFLVPVGGAVIVSPNKHIIKSISQAYAGRASAGPVVQLLVSLLSMGKNGYKTLMTKQREARSLLEDQMTQVAAQFHEKVIHSNNTVSCAMTLSQFSPDQIAKLGGYLYNLRVTGPRVIDRNKSTFGSCTTLDQLPCSYLVMNAAIGVNPSHIREATQRLKNALLQFTSNESK